MCISLISCKDDDNPVSSPSMTGTWNLVTYTDLESEFTVTAGEPTEIAPGLFFTVTGSLVATETRFTVTLSMTLSMLGYPPETEIMTSMGTYSTSGSTLTIVDDETGETETMFISRSDNRMTIRDDDVILIFEKE